MAAHRTRQTGLSLVELMVGLALGLMVTAVGLGGLAAHLRESRALAMEARLMQDLRAATDLVVRGLRRSGHWHAAGTRVGTGHENPHDTWDVGTSQVSFAYQREANEATSAHMAYRLREGVIEVQMGRGNWQALTDAGTLHVTALDLRPQTTETPLDGLCAKPCPADNSTTCPPRQQQRQIALRITAQATHDPSVQRHIEATVQLRNDRITGACAT